eukprot:11176567-Lingulodinium_polyedra.AAC.1
MPVRVVRIAYCIPLRVKKRWSADLPGVLPQGRRCKCVAQSVCERATQGAGCKRARSGCGICSMLPHGSAGCGGL